MVYDYDASLIRVLDPSNIVQNARRRPGMYFGHLGPDAVLHVLMELISNVVDLYLARMASWVRVDFEGSTVDVCDDGPGLPFDVRYEDGALGTALLTRAHITASAFDHAPHVHMQGLHGVGLAPINAVCRVFECWSWRDGQRWYQRFEAGRPVDMARVVEQGDGVGTRIRFQIDEDVLEAVLPDMDDLHQSLVQATSLSPGFLAYLDGHEICYPNGLRDRLIELATVEMSDAQQKRWIAESLFACHHQTEHFGVQVAAGGVADETHWQSWVNGTRSKAGGIHEQGFSALLRSIGWSPQYVLLSVIGLEPQFAGPTKDELLHLASWQDIEPILWDALTRSRFYE